MTIRYVDGSLAGPFCEAEYESLKQLIQLDIPGFDLDADYLAHVRKHNGGVPVDKYFRSQGGIVWSIDLFLNFVDTTTVDAITAGHNVLAFLEEVEDQTSIYFIPFAIIGGGNFLCFDYSDAKSPPAVVTWYLERSEGELVANTFAEFLAMLTEESP